MSRTPETDTTRVSFTTPLPEQSDHTLLNTAAETFIEILNAENISVEHVSFFGSQVTGTATDDSDLDILIVSPAFEDVDYHKRGLSISLEWPVLELPPIDMKALTPEEFALKQEKEDNETINAALTEGVTLNIS